MKYPFYEENSDVIQPCENACGCITNPATLYCILSQIWCKETCAPRMQKDWSVDNKTLGQCSVTAFLAQDIFGGDVYGILLSDGNYHCFNVVGDSVFDLTSEQFGNQKLNYSAAVKQKRSVHFQSIEKKLRYELLKTKLKGVLTKC